MNMVLLFTFVRTSLGNTQHHSRVPALMTHDCVFAGAVLHHARVPALSSSVRLQVVQGIDILLHQQCSYLPLSLLRLLSKGVQEERKDRMNRPQ
jgi:hypothetical protein